MARPNKIWYRKDRKTYYVTIDGNLHNLGKDKHIAQKAFHDLMASEVKPMSRITVAELLDRFLTWTSENRAPRTLDWYKAHLQHFLDSLKNQNMLAENVKPFHVNEWVSGKDWSVSYRRGAMVAVQRAFKWAVQQGYLPISPVIHLEKPDAERRDNCPTKEDYELILSKIKGQDFKDVLTFAWLTGCRPKELRIMEARHFKGGKIVFPVNESKGKKRKRIIYLTDEARAIVERRIGEGLIFTNRNGNKWTAFAINCRMRRLAEKTGKHFCLGDFRHGFATRMLESGLDHIVVAKLLGHSTTAVLSKYYAHIGNNQDFLQKQLNSVG